MSTDSDVFIRAMIFLEIDETVGKNIYVSKGELGGSRFQSFYSLTFVIEDKHIGLISSEPWVPFLI